LENIPNCILFDKSKVLGGWQLVLLGGEFSGVGLMVKGLGGW
jgi:hypothetical protein